MQRPRKQFFRVQRRNINYDSTKIDEAILQLRPLNKHRAKNQTIQPKIKLNKNCENSKKLDSNYQFLRVCSLLEKLLPLVDGVATNHLSLFNGSHFLYLNLQKFNSDVFSLRKYR